jgi:hypothetical protein
VSRYAELSLILLDRYLCKEEENSGTATLEAACTSIAARAKPSFFDTAKYQTNV